MDATRRSLLGLALAAPLANGLARPAAPPLLLPREAAPGVDPAGYLVSEKYDGARASWDGRALRFRSGLPVPAPAWFTAHLPPQPLDGELWLARGRFETLSGIVRRQQPRDDEWRQLHYMVFEQPGGAGDFTQRAARLRVLARDLAWPQLAAVEQAPVSDSAALQRRLDAVVRAGGEGLVLHRADAAYRTGRSDVLLKLKPLNDAEAVVIAQQPGQGRLAGRMGALRVRGEDGSEFLIGTGFTDAQRDHPPPPGSVLTYTYRGTTAQGVPRFASFLRLRDGL